jgi:hypothetical protein
MKVEQPIVVAQLDDPIAGDLGTEKTAPVEKAPEPVEKAEIQVSKIPDGIKAVLSKRPASKADVGRIKQLIGGFKPLETQGSFQDDLKAFDEILRG